DRENLSMSSTRPVRTTTSRTEVRGSCAGAVRRKTESSVLRRATNRLRVLRVLRSRLESFLQELVQEYTVHAIRVTAHTRPDVADRPREREQVGEALMFKASALSEFLQASGRIGAAHSPGPEHALRVLADPGDGRGPAHQGLRERLGRTDRERSDQLDGWSANAGVGTRPDQAG